MKREILFRAKKWISGEWLEGEVHLKCNNAHIHTNYADQYKIDEDTVCQFTGMTDKNGTKIFEGDIYTIGDDNIRYVVVWRKCMFIGKQIGSNSYAGLDYFESEIKKVGNIHDNPELLK